MTERDIDETPAVEITGLNKMFGNAVALHSLDLTVHRGEFLVLLGPSGCGKTTTMRSIAGLEDPTKGRITIDGEVVFDSRKNINIGPAARRVGMVFQSYAIWPHRTVAENIGFPLKMQRVARREARARVDEALTLVGLEGLGGRSASMLSGGQMQRVALARSIVMRPSVLLLDEPLSNLDAKLRERLRLELKQTQQRLGTTSVYVTHDQAEALALADRIVLMKQGAIEQIAEPLELYNNPQTRFAAEFIGTNNTYEGSAEVQGRVSRVGIPRLGTLASSYSAGPGPVAVTIRAEDVIINPPEQWEGSTVEGRVDVVSLLGSQVHYSVRAGSGDARVEVITPFDNSLYRRGDIVQLGFRLDSVRCFASESDAS